MWFNDYFSLWTIFFGHLHNQNTKVTKIQNISGHDDLWHCYGIKFIADLQIREQYNIQIGKI